MPLPRSSASNSRPVPSASLKRLAWICPPPACFTRLVASSVTTIATSSMRSGGNPIFRARSRTRRRPSATWLASVTGMNTLSPTCEHDRGALPWRGRDVELVAEPPRATQAQAKSGTSRVSVLQRHRQIDDARPLIDESQPDASSLTVAQRFQTQRPAAAIVHSIAADFAGGSNDLGLVHQRETGGDGSGADCLPHPYHVVGRAQRHFLSRLDLHQALRYL